MTNSTEDEHQSDVALLIERAREGSSDALGELIETIRAYLLYVATQRSDTRLSPKVAVSDVVQDACVRAHERFSSFRGETEAELRAWMRTILLNSMSDSRRKFVESKKRGTDREVEMDPARPLPSSDLTPHSAALAREEAALLNEAMSQLSEDHRQVLRLRNWELLTFAEIAERMGRSSDAAQKLWTRAVKELESRLLKDN